MSTFAVGTGIESIEESTADIGDSPQSNLEPPRLKLSGDESSEDSKAALESYFRELEAKDLFSW